MYGEDRRFDSRKPQLQANLNVKDQHYSQEERNFTKQSYINQAQANLKTAAERMKEQYDKNLCDKNLLPGDKVYIKREYVKQGISKKLSTVYDDLSTVMEANHPIYKVKRIGSGKEGSIHHNRLRKKENFLPPQVQAKFTPCNQPKPPSPLIDNDDDTMSELDFPMVISNSNMSRANPSTISPTEVSSSQEHSDEHPLISLDGAPAGTVQSIVQSIEANPNNPTTTQGLIFNDEGRRVSTRTRKPTTSDQFTH